MQLRQLEHFLAVVDHGGITAAAQALYVSQPSLSQSIRKLEQDLGVVLFDRSGRATLTAAGRELLVPAREAVRSAVGITELAEEIRGLRAGTLRLAALGTLASEPLPQILGEFRRRFPRVQVEVTDPPGPRGLVDSVLAGEVELGLTDVTLPQKGVVPLRLGSQEIVLVVPPQDAGTLPDPIPLEELGRLDFVAPPSGAGDSPLRGRAIRDQPVRVVVECPTWDAVIAMVHSGAGATVLSREVASRTFDPSQIVRISPSITRDVGLIRRPGRVSPAAEAFLEVAVGSPQVRSGH